MKLKKLSVTCILFFTSIGSAMSVTDSYLQVETKWSQNKQTSVLHRAYAKHVKQDPIAALTEDDLNIFRSLIADNEVVAVDLNCRADLADSVSASLQESSEMPISPICENGVKHVFGTVLKPRILDLTYANGTRRQVTVGLKKPASGFCSAIENQMGIFMTSVNTGDSISYNEEKSVQFHAQETSVSNMLNSSQAKRLGMALYRCCQPVDNGKQSCVEKIQETLKNEDNGVRINSR